MSPPRPRTTPSRDKSDSARRDGAANSNHGTFYYNQLAALQVLVGDTDGAKATVEDYFTGKYKAQIAADGDQVRVPHVCTRRRPDTHRRGGCGCGPATHARSACVCSARRWRLLIRHVVFLLFFFVSQPLETARTRPYHYRAYNIAAMIVRPRPLSSLARPAC